jgi:hypothetical protein
MTVEVKIRVELEAGEDEPSEAKALMTLQTTLAELARMTPDEFTKFWRQATIIRPRAKHRSHPRGSR